MMDILTERVTMVGIMLGFLMGFVIISYVYMALALSTVAKKLGHSKPWLAWIPIGNIVLILQLGNVHAGWIFAILIPLVGWLALGIMNIQATWRIFEKRNYPGWLALVTLGSFIPFVGYVAMFAQFIIWGLVAWQDR